MATVTITLVDVTEGPGDGSVSMEMDADPPINLGTINPFEDPEGFSKELDLTPAQYQAMCMWGYMSTAFQILPGSQEVEVIHEEAPSDG